MSSSANGRYSLSNNTIFRVVKNHSKFKVIFKDRKWHKSTNLIELWLVQKGRQWRRVNSSFGNAFETALEEVREVYELEFQHLCFN